MNALEVFALADDLRTRVAYTGNVELGFRAQDLRLHVSASMLATDFDHDPATGRVSEKVLRLTVGREIDLERRDRTGGWELSLAETRRAVHELLCHEADESLRVDRDLYVNPHADEGPAPP